MGQCERKKIENLSVGKDLVFFQNLKSPFTWFDDSLKGLQLHWFTNWFIEKQYLLLAK